VHQKCQNLQFDRVGAIKVAQLVLKAHTIKLVESAFYHEQAKKEETLSQIRVFTKLNDQLIFFSSVMTRALNLLR
jgi:hypothetical protein